MQNTVVQSKTDNKNSTVKPIFGTKKKPMKITNIHSFKKNKKISIITNSTIKITLFSVSKYPKLR